MQIKDIINAKEYDFLRANEQLKGRLIFLVLGGSHAYGTANPDSDIDIRGCAFNNKTDLLGLSSFEHFVEPVSDTTIYSFNKLIGLFLNANPNSIEMLGCKPEHYAIFNSVAQEMIDNRKLFLSRRAAASFGGYADQQLKRLQNAVARDALTQAGKEEHILKSIKNQMATFNGRYAGFDEGAIKLYVDSSDKAGYDAEIFIDAGLSHYPLRDFVSIMDDMQKIMRNYSGLNHRNNKKSENKLAKHAMHLIRLYLMAIDIFEKEEIITYRKNDLDLLRSIRNGKYMNDDGTYQNEFFEMVNEYDKRLAYAIENSGLPEHPDMKLVEDFVVSVNERVVSGECH